MITLVQGEVEAVGRLHSDWMTHFKARPLQLTLMRTASEPALLAGETALKLRTGEYEVYGARPIIGSIFRRVTTWD
jgi:hypothetical protein